MTTGPRSKQAPVLQPRASSAVEMSLQGMKERRSRRLPADRTHQVDHLASTSHLNWSFLVKGIVKALSFAISSRTSCSHKYSELSLLRSLGLGREASDRKRKGGPVRHVNIEGCVNESTPLLVHLRKPVRCQSFIVNDRSRMEGRRLCHLAILERNGNTGDQTTHRREHVDELLRQNDSLEEKRLLFSLLHQRHHNRARL